MSCLLSDNYENKNLQMIREQMRIITSKIKGLNKLEKVCSHANECICLYEKDKIYGQGQLLGILLPTRTLINILEKSRKLPFILLDYDNIINNIKIKMQMYDSYKK
ncbi:hypothetical protein NUSPORA_02146 [Nucleospora cyclopteri]